MEEALDIPPMDLKASAELEVRKLQDMVKRLERQNEILRHSQNGGQADVIALRKRNSVELEEVTLINLNDSSDDLEDSWLYESPVKSATPAQKSVNSIKWTKTLSADGLDDVRGNLIDKLDDIETQQEISKVRVLQNPEGKVSLVNTPKSSLFFQPTPKTLTSQRNGDTPGPVSQNTKSDELMYENNQLDSSAYGSMDEMEDIPQGPILRRSALAKDRSPEFNIQQSTSLSQSENIDEETQAPILRRSALGKDSSTKYNLQQTVSQSQETDEESQGPILRRSALGKSGSKSEVPKVSQSDDIDDEMQQGPILRRSALGKSGYKSEVPKVSQSDDIVDEMQGPISRRSAAGKRSPQQPRAMFQPDVFDDAPQGPVLRRSALPKDTKKSPSQLNGSPESQRQAVNTSPMSRMQPRSRRIQLTDNDVAERSNLDTSSQSSQDDLDDDINDKGPIVRRSALALPRPSAEGLSKQLWYSGPVNQMNKQKLKADSTAVRRSVSPSPDRRNKLQPRSPAAASGIAPRRSTGSRGSMEDLLDTDDSAPVQRRSLPQIPTETAGVKSRTAKSDEGITNRTQAKPKSKVQNLQQPQGNVVSRRSKLATPNTSKENRGVVARRKAPSQTSNESNLDDSWKEGCY